MIWLTADTHFSHDSFKGGIIKYCNRPFASIEEMDSKLIENWNRYVSLSDTIYHLGDVLMPKGKNNREKANEILSQLKGKKYLVPSLDHDTHYMDVYRRYFTILQPIHIFKDGDFEASLCHYCMRTWSKSHYNVSHLYGHSHGRLPSIGKSMDVGVDCNNFFPFSLDEIKKIMETKEDNPNYIK